MDDLDKLFYQKDLPNGPFPIFYSFGFLWGTLFLHPLHIKDIGRNGYYWGYDYDEGAQPFVS